MAFGRFLRHLCVSIAAARTGRFRTAFHIVARPAMLNRRNIVMPPARLYFERGRRRMTHHQQRTVAFRLFASAFQALFTRFLAARFAGARWPASLISLGRWPRSSRRVRTHVHHEKRNTSRSFDSSARFVSRLLASYSKIVKSIFDLSAPRPIPPRGFSPRPLQMPSRL